MPTFSFGLTGPLSKEDAFRYELDLHNRQNGFPPMQVTVIGSAVTVSVPSLLVPEKEVRKSLNTALILSKSGCCLFEQPENQPGTALSKPPS
jgi:hypothetical protein